MTATQIDTLSFTAIVQRFGDLPATSQAALIMAGLAAFIIPIGALVAGEGLAALVLEKRSGGDFREQRWQEVEFTVIYRAVFVRYLQQGITEKAARQRAFSEVKGYLGKGSSSGVRLLSAPSGQTGQGANTPDSPDEQTNSAKGRVHRYLDAHPDLTELSINQLLTALKSAGVQAGRTTIAEVLQERKQTV